MKNRSIAGRSIIGIVILIIELFRIRYVQDFGEVFRNAYWFVDFRNSNRLFQSIVLLMLPQILVLVLWGDYFEEMIYGNASVLLPRMRNVGGLLRKFFIELIGKVGITLLLFSTIISGFCVFRGISEYGKEDIVNLGLYILYMVVFLVFINVVSAFSSSVVGTLAGLAVQTSGLIAVGCLGECDFWQAAWIPSYVFVLLQRENVLSQKLAEMIYLLILLGLFFVMECFIVKRKEWR